MSSTSFYMIKWRRRVSEESRNKKKKFQKADLSTNCPARTCLLAILLPKRLIAMALDIGNSANCHWHWLPNYFFFKFS